MTDLGIVRLYDDAWLPMKASDCAAGFDIWADFWKDKITVYNTLNEKITVDVQEDSDEEKYFVLPPRNRALITTGISLYIPHGFCVLVFPRSGLAVKEGLGLVNSVGVIDSDYSGELLIPVINHSDVDVTIGDGERVAQIMMVPVLETQIMVRSMDELLLHVNNTGRETGDAGGFGSTGK